MITAAGCGWLEGFFELCAFGWPLIIGWLWTFLMAFNGVKRCAKLLFKMRPIPSLLEKVILTPIPPLASLITATVHTFIKDCYQLAIQIWLRSIVPQRNECVTIDIILIASDWVRNECLHRTRNSAFQWIPMHKDENFCKEFSSRDSLRVVE